MERPKIGSTPIMLRLPPDLLADLDRWIADVARKMKASGGSRPEAIRNILQNHFETQRHHWAREDTRKPKPAKRNQSADLAGRTIDAIDDQSALAEDRAKRKRRLLKGPHEFREMRRDARKEKR
jgi:hypothetical protein